jgi:Zn-dependent membrane protease YugP
MLLLPAVAAHECGHAVQHAQAYSWLEMRSALVPLVSISSRLSMWVILAGLMLGFGAGLGLGYWVAVLGFVLMAVATSFSFVTLPVEYDASNRALAWLKNKNMVSREEYDGAQDASEMGRSYLFSGCIRCIGDFDILGTSNFWKRLNFNLPVKLLV